MTTLSFRAKQDFLERDAATREQRIADLRQLVVK